jgi:putative membrane protein
MPIFFLAHAGHHLEASEVMRWWSFEPIVTATIIITLVLYTIGLTRSRAVKPWQAASFYAGSAALIVALISPLDALGGILFSAHMAQHEVLMVIAAPLLVLGRPLVPFMWALPSSWRLPIAHVVQREPIASTWHVATSPLVAATTHALALWIWHAPSLYQATLRSDFIHSLQHISFLGTAMLFWWTLIHGRFGRMGYGVAVFYVFITTIHSGALGALLTFSPHVWYPIYRATTTQWGLDPIEDQQLAGLIMWVPAGVILVVLGLALFVAWLAEAERRVRLTESDMLVEETKRG